MTWSVTYQTPDGSITESGTFTLSADGTSFGKSADYVLTQPNGLVCEGICTGTGTRL